MIEPRIKSFPPEKVSGFFHFSVPEYNKIQDFSQQVFSVDKTGITIVQHKHSKVISLKGKTQISTLTSRRKRCNNRNNLHECLRSLYTASTNFSAQKYEGG
nr:unnamed protein product [Callosobruchus chinensis]